MSLPVRRGRYRVRQWDPFGRWGVDNLFDQMNRMLSTASPDVARITVTAWAPPVDVQESDDEYAVEADLPGVRPEDVTVDVQGRRLRITGAYGQSEPPAGSEGKTEKNGKSEKADPGTVRRSGRFDYRVTLPGDVDAEAARAEMENGTLRLRLPKVTPSAGRSIPVQTGKPKKD
ncbi:hypothetical protein BJF78_05130 [Pseudonocardia sp. CNS-139]|nr:hypothetical protein BJF78_05130 [Pseudonocardia sp. CNS-139]